MARRIVSGSGSDRIETALARPPSLPLRPTTGCGRPGVGVEDTDVDGAADACTRHLPVPARGRRSERCAAVTYAQRLIDGRQHWAVELAELQAPLREPGCGILVGVDAVGRQPRRQVRGTRAGGGGAVGGTSSGRRRVTASIAEARVRGAHSFHCSPSQRRAQSWAWTWSGSGCQDRGSPVSESNRSPDCWATRSPDRYRSASAFVRKARLRWRPVTDQRTTHGRLLRSPERFCTPYTATSASGRTVSAIVGRGMGGSQLTRHHMAFDQGKRGD